jgi:exonuclease SbcC
MWVIESIKGENLFGYKKFDISIKNNQTTLIYGLNKTDKNVKSNGSGKSSILDIIAVLLTGEPVRDDINSTDIIRNGKSEGEGEIYMVNSVTKQTLLITQKLFQSKTNRPYIIVNGKLREDLKDLKPKETYAEILKLLGINKDDLFNYFLISKEKYESFFKSNDATRKAIINRFSNAAIIDPLDDKIKKDIDKKENELDKIKDSINTIQARITLYEEERQEILDIDVDEEKQEKIQKLENEIESLKESIEEAKEELKQLDVNHKTHFKNLDTFTKQLHQHEKEISDRNKEEEEVQTKITSLDDKLKKLNESHQKNIDLVEQEIKTARKEKERLEEELREINTFKSTVESQLEESIECPKCHHKFHLRDEEFDYETALTKIPECDEMIKEVNNDIELINQEIKKLTSKKTTLDTEKENASKVTRENRSKLVNQLNELSKKKSVLRTTQASLEESIRKAKLNITSLDGMIEIQNKDISSARAKIKEITASIKAVKVSESDKAARLVEYDQKIKVEKEKLIEPEKKKEECEEYIEKRTKWRLNFKKFKSYLANTAISAIQEQTNHYLERMDTNLEIMIDGYRELSNGNLKEEISLFISRDGLEGEKPGKFSGGEKSKCDLASIVGMQTLINQSSPTGGLNFMFIDEILESNDDVALSYIIKGLNNIGRTVFLITHVNPDTIFQDCNGLIVKKENKISEIRVM